MEPITMAAYITAHHITMRATRINAHDQLHAVGNQWRCTLSRLESYRMRYGDVLDQQQTHPKMTVTYTSTAQPVAADVLARLSVDSAGIRGKSFVHWCADLCLDSDSRRVESEYTMRKVMAERLRVWLSAGDHAYNCLLYRVEGGSN